VLERPRQYLQPKRQQHGHEQQDLGNGEDQLAADVTAAGDRRQDDHQHDRRQILNGRPAERDAPVLRVDVLALDHDLGGHDA
jgi:hypothetical protein